MHPSPAGETWQVQVAEWQGVPAGREAHHFGGSVFIGPLCLGAPATAWAAARPPRMRLSDDWLPLFLKYIAAQG